MILSAMVLKVSGFKYKWVLVWDLCMLLCATDLICSQSMKKFMSCHTTCCPRRLANHVTLKVISLFVFSIVSL